MFLLGIDTTIKSYACHLSYAIEKVFGIKCGQLGLIVADCFTTLWDIK